MATTRACCAFLTKTTNCGCTSYRNLRARLPAPPAKVAVIGKGVGEMTELHRTITAADGTFRLADIGPDGLQSIRFFAAWFKEVRMGAVAAGAPPLAITMQRHETRMGKIAGKFSSMVCVTGRRSAGTTTRDVSCLLPSS